jgi:hypothetical protein
MTWDDTRFSGLLDAEERHRQDPDSFSIPRSDVRRTLAPGDLVKLLFGAGSGDPPTAERMWVMVLEANVGRYLGRLDNEPRAISDLPLGAQVRFGPEHVAAIHREAPQDSPTPEQFAIVSDDVWRAGVRPARAVRLPAPDDSFSGWVVFGSPDASAPPADLAGFQPVSHQALTDRYRSFDSIEVEPVPSAWRWDPQELEWQPDTSDG